MPLGNCIRNAIAIAPTQNADHVQTSSLFFPDLVTGTRQRIASSHSHIECTTQTPPSLVLQPTGRNPLSVHSVHTQNAIPHKGEQRCMEPNISGGVSRHSSFPNTALHPARAPTDPGHRPRVHPIYGVYIDRVEYALAAFQPDSIPMNKNYRLSASTAVTPECRNL